MKHNMTDTEYKDLFKAYLDVCNEALQKNKNHFPYKQLWGASEKILGDFDISMAVYDDRPKDTFLLHVDMHEKHLDIVEEEKGSEKAWKVNYSYLKHVVEHPDEYIKNPARLDWDWISNRIGLVKDQDN